MATIVIWAVANEGESGWAIRVLVAVSTLVLLALAAATSLVVAGGLIVLYRDACEERGVPYTPARSRERIIGPMAAAVRRRLRPRARLRPGEIAEVRGLAEIQATLDEHGCTDGLPFMPEMVRYCGHRFRVHRRVDKVWEYAHGTGVRRVHDAVLLRKLRCDGQSHGGCQASCELIWKEAWLRPSRARSPLTPSESPTVDLDACTQIPGEAGPRYVCQMTEIIRASTPISRRNTAHYWRDLIRGNTRIAPLLIVLGVRAFNSANWRLGGEPWPVLKPLDGDSSPHEELSLQPGEWVRVKPKHALETTLNRNLRNRGLEFGTDQLFCAGGSYRVAARVDRILDERTGEMIVFKTPSILLEGAHANGGGVLTPQNEFFFWREIWLEREPAPTRGETFSRGSESPGSG